MKLELGTTKKWLLLLLLLIPFVSIILVIAFRQAYNPTNEEILESIKSAKAYSSKVEYIVKNPKGEYKEETSIYYGKEQGMRIEFGQERVKIYKDGYINMNDHGDEYELNGDLDEVYTLAFMENLLSNEVKEIKEGSEEWGDTKYLEVEIALPFKNKHMNFAKLYINKIDKCPIIAKVYDVDNNEKLAIVYRDFKYLDEVNKELF